MQSRTVKKCLKEIVSPSLSELGFQLREQVTVERERIWCYWKVINGEKCEIIFRVSILNTITVDLIIPPMIQVSLVDVDPQASFDKTDMTANAVITNHESQMAPRLRRSRHLPTVFEIRATALLSHTVLPV